MNPEDCDFDTEAGCIAAAKAERARRDAYNAEHGVKAWEDCAPEEREAFYKFIQQGLQSMEQPQG